MKDVKDIELQKILNNQAGKSKSYLSKMRITLKSILKQARISRYIQYDPAENLVMPQATSGSRRSITPEEREAILKLAETHHAGLWIKTILYCGLRPGDEYVKHKLKKFTNYFFMRTNAVPISFNGFCASHIAGVFK